MTLLANLKDAKQEEHRCNDAIKRMGLEGNII